MKISEIYKFLDELSPFDLQESWDNSGLLIGDFSQDITKIVLSIDVDEALIDSMEENTLLILIIHLYLVDLNNFSLTNTQQI